LKIITFLLVRILNQELSILLLACSSKDTRLTFYPVCCISVSSCIWCSQMAYFTSNQENNEWKWLGRETWTEV